MLKSVLFFMLLTLGTASAQQLDKYFLGNWHVDVEKTVAAVQKSHPGQTVPPAVLEKMKMMGMIVKANSLTLMRGEKGATVKTKWKSGTKFGAVLYCDSNGKQVRVELTRVHSDRMNFKSAASDDMDDYVWKRPSK